MQPLPKILFTSPCGPYPKLPVDKDPIDYFYYRNTLKQGLFQLRSFQSWHPLHFLAQNIALPSVVIENPTFNQFKKEVSDNNYSIVAITFTVLSIQSVYEMVSWLKKERADIKIVLGGYGTAIFNENAEIPEKLKSLVDFICYGEGLAEINKIIYSLYQIRSSKTELTQDLIPVRNSFFRTRINLFGQTVLIGGLGCVYGCSFCATSSQFRHKYIPLFSGKKLFDCLYKQSCRYPEIKSAIIYDEDFLANRSRFDEFTECFKNSSLSKKSFFITIFASVKSLLNYTIEELLQAGIGTIFIGVESFDNQILDSEKLLKRNGDIASLFDTLHRHGINTLGSLVVGWDEQTKEMALADSSRFIALNPTFYQVVPLQVVPGTRLWEKMKSEGRTGKDIFIKNENIALINFEPKNMSRNEVEKVVTNTYTGLVAEGGPWPFRLFENVLTGYTCLKNKNGIFAARALKYKKQIFPLCLLAFSSMLFFRSRSFLKRWFRSMKKFARQFPFLFTLTLLLLPFTTVVLIIIYGWGQIRYTLNPLGDQPDTLRKEY